jgi:hypothetical protein
MAPLDVITELNTDASWYYDKFSGEQRLFTYSNGHDFIWKDVYDGSPYVWETANREYTIYYDTTWQYVQQGGWSAF